MSKYQNERRDPLKPSVVKKGSRWWARVWTPDCQFKSSLHMSQPEALAKAYELAALREASK